MRKVTPLNRGYAPGEKVKLDSQQRKAGAYTCFSLPLRKRKEKMNNDEEYLE